MTGYTIYVGKKVNLSNLKNIIQNYREEHSSIIDGEKEKWTDKIDIVSNDSNHWTFIHEFKTEEEIKQDEDESEENEEPQKYLRKHVIHAVVWNEDKYSVFLVSKKEKSSTTVKICMNEFNKKYPDSKFSPKLAEYSDGKVKEFLERRYQVKRIYTTDINDRITSLSFGGDIMTFSTGQPDVSLDYEHYMESAVKSALYEDSDTRLENDVWFSTDKSSVTSKKAKYLDLEGYIKDNILKLIIQPFSV
ncbi:MAG: hypothetical protein PHW22_04405 [Bacilli bacterium]|nr:hypothetical protein [Bacilli bacterium]